MEVRTDGSLFWNLTPKEISVRWDDNPVVQRYQIPPAAGSDGASLPAFARAIRPSLWNRMFCAAFCHDAAYRNTLLRWDIQAEQWVKANLTLQQSNELLEALMFIEATSEFERATVFEALQWFGSKAFNEDRILATGERTEPQSENRPSGDPS